MIERSASRPRNGPLEVGISRRRLMTKAAIAGTAGAVFSVADVANPAEHAGAAVDSLRSYYDVMDYGATGNGLADDRAAIQATIDAAQAASGGVVLLPTGTYAVGGTLRITRSNISMRGAGSGSVLKCTFVSGDVIYAGAAIENVALEDFSIISSVNKTSGAAVYCDYAQRFRIVGIKAAPAEMPTPTLYDGFYFRYFDNCVVTNSVVNCSHRGVTLHGRSDQTWGAGFYLIGGSKVSTNYASGSVGIYIGGSTGGINVEDCDVIACETSVRIDKDLSTSSNREIFINQSFLDGSANHNLYVAPQAIGLLHLVGSWIASAGQLTNGFPDGTNFTVASPQMGGDVIMQGCRIFNAKGSGIIANAGAWTVNGCSIHNNGQGANGGHGIAFYNPLVSNATITGNSIKFNGNGLLGQGLRVVPGVNSYLISGNLIRANGSAQLIDGGGPNKVVTNNLLT